MFQRSPQPEAFIRARCARCRFVFIFSGPEAERTVYQLFFGTLILGAELDMTCRNCRWEKVVIEDGGYTVPTRIAA